MANREMLKRALLMKMGLPPGHPTDSEMKLIIEYISSIRAVRPPTDADWKAACARYVLGAGTYIYAAEDTSDLNELLFRILDS